MTITLNSRTTVRNLVLTLALTLSAVSEAEETVQYSPPVANNYPSRLLWGDTHLHTNQSPDAFTFGNRGVTPDQAYRFARGEMVVSETGVKAKLARPLDFLMISDHSEFMGIFPKVFSRSPDIMATPLGQRWWSHVEAGHPERVLMEFGLISMGVLDSHSPEELLSADASLTPEFLEGLKDVKVPQELRQGIWNQVGEVADTFNEPGRFTAFIGYEWTSMPDGNNLHRNVLFRDDSSRTSQIAPFSSMDSGDPEDLWEFLASYEKQTGGRAMAIPHNGNVSNGLMFAETTLDNKPLNRDYAERRSRWEPIV